MANIIKIKRGTGANPTGLTEGELALRKDTGEIFIHDGASIVKVASKDMLTKAGGTLTGYLTLYADPTNNNHAATKHYVDNFAAGLDMKGSTKVATTANITLSGGQTIDGVSVADGDRILVKDQSDPVNNGIYIANTGGAWSRASDFSSGTATFGAAVFVELGTANAGKGFVCISLEDKSGDINIGTDTIDWTQFSAAQAYTAGNGISISSGVVSVKKGNGLDFSGTDLVAKAGDATISVNSAGIKVGTIQAANIADGAVGTNQLAATSVTKAKLGNDVAGTGLTGGNGSALAVSYGSSAGTACQGNDSRLHSQNTDAGTNSSTFYIGSSGPKIKNASGAFSFRNNADNAYVNIGAAKLITYSGAYNHELLPGTLTANRTLTMPDKTGTILTDNSDIDGGSY